MRTLKIVTAPDPGLQAICEPCDPSDKSLKKLAQRMAATMYKNNGCGLAAPQVTYLMHELKEKGLNVDTDATTVAEARACLLEALTGIDSGKTDFHM
mgnify:CR=1 FL=1